MTVAERLGYRCPRCSFYSLPTDRHCPSCGNVKQQINLNQSGNPFRDLVGGILELTVPGGNPQEAVRTTRLKNGVEEVVAYERAEDKIRVLDQRQLERRRAEQKESPHKVLVKIDRSTFVMATGASETELLGDVRHDPYGGHPQLGSQPYDRVIPGAIHEAHEGVLFIDELPSLGPLQRFILTAMQEKRFPISGRNPQSGGASVRVDSVPCDFILVAACNIADLSHILSPLRSRIAGGGYEVLLDTAMPDNEHNRIRLAQFCAQEIVTDGRIRHATTAALEELFKEARPPGGDARQPAQLAHTTIAGVGRPDPHSRRPGHGGREPVYRSLPDAAGAPPRPVDRGTDQGDLRILPGGDAPGFHGSPTPVARILRVERAPRPGRLRRVRVK